MSADGDTRPGGPGRPPPGLGHRPGLDSLRGVAVAVVVAYHLGWLSGGFLGVDVFFVLSGFLVTSLLLDELEREGRFGLVAFWQRRARRLVPAVLVAVPAVVAAALVLDWPATARRGLALDGVATLSWWANWRQLLVPGGGYWSDAPALFRHAWSLSIEEQFYLGWPLAVLAVAALARHRGWPVRTAIGGAAAALAAASATWSVILAHRLPADDLSRVYLGTDTRVLAPLVGCALAGLSGLRPRSGAPAGPDDGGGSGRGAGAPPGDRAGRGAGPGAAGGGGDRGAGVPGARPGEGSGAVPGAARVRGLVGLAGAGVLAAMVVGVHVSAPGLYRWGGLALAALAAAALVVAAAGLRRVDPVTSWLGLRSYAVYLWSWPVQVLVQHRWPALGRTGVTLLVVPLALGLAEASHHLVEHPVRRATGWWRAPRRRAGLLAGSALAVVGVLVAAVATARALPPHAQRTDEEVVDRATLPAAVPPGGGEGLRVLLVGDSVPYALGETLAPVDYGPGIGVVDSRALPQCGLFVLGAPEAFPLRHDPDTGAVGPRPRSPTCAAQAEAEALGLAARPDVVVLMPGAWEAGDVWYRGEVLPAWGPELEDFVVESILLRVGQARAVGARVLIVEWACPGDRWPDWDMDKAQFARWLNGRAIPRAAREGRAGGARVDVLAPDDTICVDGDPAGSPTPETDRARPDGIHVEDASGAAHVWRWIATGIAATGTAPG